MSYCRNNRVDSELYVISVGDGWECLGCPSAEEVPSGIGVPMKGRFFCQTRQEMLDHLLEHRRRGHKVPERAIERLKEEIISVRVKPQQ